MFTLAPENETGPRRFYDELIIGAPEFDLIRRGEPTVSFLFRNEPKIKAGRNILGTVYMPTVQGELNPLFEWMLERLFTALPDYLFVLDLAYWETASVRQREILMFHEMAHCDQARDRWGSPKFHRETGAPLWRLVGHDIEEFNAVVARYGEHSPDVQQFIASAEIGESKGGSGGICV